MIDGPINKFFYILGGGSTGALTAIVIITIVLIRNPEKIDKWIALIFRWLNSVKFIFRFAHKQYIRHDLQGRVNEFTKGLSKEAPFLASTRIRVELIASNITRESFLKDGQVILRLRRDDTEDLNFTHGAYMFVSTSLLFKVKRYISQSQRQAVDLYVTTKLLEKEKPVVVGHFLDEYLHPKIANTESEIASYFDKFAKIDKGGMLYPLLLQELYFLGNKVFGNRKDHRIINDVNLLTDFLESIASRKIGEDCNLEFDGTYCRFRIIIVGKYFKLTPEGAAYVKFIKKKIIPKNIETLYVIGLWENKDILDKICVALEGAYEKCRVRKSEVYLKYGNKTLTRNQYLIILRKKGISLFQPSE